MSFLNKSRREFLLTSAMVGALSVTPFPMRLGHAQGARVLRIRLERDMSVLDPGYMLGGSTNAIMKATMPSLVYYGQKDGKLTWIPTDYVEHIAQRDPTHIDFTLKPGFQWTNGFGEFTAEDVKFTYERQKTTNFKGYYKVLNRVDIKDKYSGTLVLNNPFAPFWLVTLAAGTATIMCQKATESVGGKYTTEVPATCGPYLYDWQPKQRITFRRNPEWTGPKPDFDEFHYILIEEEKTAELAYEAGEIDMTQLSLPTFARYQKALPKNSKLHDVNSSPWGWLGMNTEHPKLRDIRVRKAIQHAVNVESVLKAAFGDVAKLSHGVVPPGRIGYREQHGYNYDPDKARALLNEAGVSGLELDLRTLSKQERVVAAQAIQSDLARVGIKAKVIPMDPGVWWNSGQEAKGDMYKDLQLYIQQFGTVNDPFNVVQWFVKDQVGIWNWERWSDQEFENLFDRGSSETDPAKRHGIYVRMQEIMEDTGAYVWLWHTPTIFVHRDTIKPHALGKGNPNFRLFKSVTV